MEKFSYVNAQNVGYIEQLFESFLQNPESVDPEWKMFFEGIEFAKKIGGAVGNFSDKELKVFELIRTYRHYGHRKAKLDPLGLSEPKGQLLALNRFNLEEKDLETSFEIGSIIGLKGAKLKEIIAKLEYLYCGSFAIEFTDCEPHIVQWVLNEYEQANLDLAKETRKAALDLLVKTEALERFIHTRFVGAKRFSVEGGDALLPMMDRLLHLAAKKNALELVVGMAHRGRVNMLANFCGKPLDLIFAEFSGNQFANQGFSADGDVKYHMGYSSDREVEGQKIHISLAFNPSHLEAVDPVVSGMTRAKQRLRKDNTDRKRVIPILIHGDAAFIGQGVVAETLQMSQLEGFTIGGTIHIVVNNQVGFTTNPEYSRSSYYCTDVGRALRVPVIHVNGDDVDACLRAIELAFRFRQEFGMDVIIDLVCYRRFGHNEADEPSFTQPKMYQAIKSHPTPKEIYCKHLAEEGIGSEGDAQVAFDKELDRMQAILDKTRSEEVAPKFFTLEGVWKGLRRPSHQDFWVTVDTQVPMDTLKEVSHLVTSWPEGFQPHPKLKKLLESRSKMLETDSVDWGMAELLCYGSLIKEQIPVRISGQDVGRGTFTHRHCIFHDSVTGQRYSPINTIHPEIADFVAHDSLLSEMAVLGFEYGNSTTDPRALTIWEAQFGDFANGAQIIIDQFIASAESKWQRMTGLVLLLPHGYEGQGPEHSSARLERFLQMCAQDNMQVAYPTTPAQLFHILRRQVKRDFRKPLIIMSPKSLLRHPKVISSADELAKGSFQEIIRDLSATRNAADVKKIIFCTGKIYFELEAERDEHYKDENVAIIRIEQLYPFPGDQILNAVKQFPNVKQIIWAQEEPKNMGAYSFVAPRLQELFAGLAQKGLSFRYLGRTERASPAIGSPKIHQQEQSDIIKGCFK
ncbi:MAG: 2-oxoglutarate dehydrogenase E1 component [Oligoflexia bacterium]|nr:2-oxoglutarate dehydrogenase E1 component [Oligoflexia bacterium]